MQNQVHTKLSVTAKVHLSKEFREISAKIWQKDGLITFSWAEGGPGYLVLNLCRGCIVTHGKVRVTEVLSRIIIVFLGPHDEVVLQVTHSDICQSSPHGNHGVYTKQYTCGAEYIRG